MAMTTYLKGRLRNTPLPKTRGLFPLFEAVVNSIHSVEDHSAASSGHICVEVLRDPQGTIAFEPSEKKPGPDAVASVIGFRIKDDGIGFTNENMTSFETLDSDLKVAKGCRGIGRLLWLKAFERAKVTSRYGNGDGVGMLRTFLFDRDQGVSDHRNCPADFDGPTETVVELQNFKEDYRQYSLKTTHAIATGLFEHCLWYFIREGGAPNIVVSDGDDTVDLDEVYEEHMVSSSQAEQIRVKGRPFELTHVRLRTTSSQAHVIAYCAAGRLVKEENIAGKVPGLFGRLGDGDESFVYSCYVVSEYLDSIVRIERTDFDFPDGSPSLFISEEITLEDIRTEILGKVQEYLGEYLAENMREGRERVEHFVAQTAPRYRPILSRIPEDKLAVDPTMSDTDLELLLHRQLNDIECELIADGHDILSPKSTENYSDYRRRVAKYLDTVSDVKKSDLAGYVSHRRVVIDLFGRAIERDDDGNYVREELIHDLIMPMGKESDDIFFDDANLWLVDERLAFHDYLASDRTLRASKITGSKSTKEPDLFVLNKFDNPILVADSSAPPLAAIVVVEIKRPMRNDAKQGEEKDPIEQALGYLERIRSGKVQTKQGRRIPQSEDIPGYCYVLCDLTDTVIQRCRLHDGILTPDGLGYFFYNKNYKAHVEVISFDRLVIAARERSRAFFDKLGLPTT